MITYKEVLDGKVCYSRIHFEIPNYHAIYKWPIYEITSRIERDMNCTVRFVSKDDKQLVVSFAIPFGGNTALVLNSKHCDFDFKKGLILNLIKDFNQYQLDPKKNTLNPDQHCEVCGKVQGVCVC